MKKAMNKKIIIECHGGEFHKPSSYSAGLRFEASSVTQCWDMWRTLEEPPAFYKSFSLILLNVTKLFLVLWEQ